uniref:hypothetical protein n=1 Tax=Legionella fairfieldensis TaxID=45064 RepID=UPI000560E194
MKNILNSLLALFFFLLIMFVINITIGFINAKPIDIHEISLLFKDSNPGICKLINIHNLSGGLYREKFFKNNPAYKDIKLNQDLFNHEQIISALNSSCLNHDEVQLINRNYTESIAVHLKNIHSKLLIRLKN